MQKIEDVTLKFKYKVLLSSREAQWHIGMSSVSASEGSQFKPWLKKNCELEMMQEI